MIEVVGHCSSSVEQSSSDQLSPILHDSQQEVSTPSVSSAPITGEPLTRLETIHEDEELEA